MSLIFSNEFLVNSTTKGGQSAPSVAALEGGNFVVTWSDESQSNDDPSGTAVRGQVFDAGGITIGSEFLVNTTTESNQSHPSVTGLEGGGFVVMWQDYSQSEDNPNAWVGRGQVFDANGAATGDEFPIKPAIVSNQTGLGITNLEGGGFVATWMERSAGDDNTSRIGVRGQVFDASGIAVGGEFLVTASADAEQLFPSVANLAGGGFVVAWTEDTGIRPVPAWTEATSQNVVDNDTGDTAVHAQVFTASGATAGDPFLVNTTTKSYQSNPSVTGLKNGGFVVTWEDYSLSGGDTSGYAVRGQSFAANGDKTGGEFLVNVTVYDNQYAPSVAGLADGSFVVSWQGNGQGDDFGIFARIFSQPEAISNADFLTTLYHNFYIREPDAGGLVFWIAQLEAGESREDVVASFAASVEAQTYSRPVINWYLALLGRVPDAGGYEYWAQQLHAGASEEEVLLGFFHSTEFQAIFGKESPDRQFVESLYLAILERQADEGGADYWTQQLASGSGRTHVARAFLDSEEFNANTGLNTQIVLTFLGEQGRLPSQQEFELALLDATSLSAQALPAFSDLPEAGLPQAVLEALLLQTANSTDDAQHGSNDGQSLLAASTDTPELVITITGVPTAEPEALAFT